MKTFNDLVFGQHINPNIKDTKQARMQFDNGYGISVLLGGETEFTLTELIPMR